MYLLIDVAHPILVDPSLAHNLVKLYLNALDLFVALNFHLLSQLSLVTVFQLQ